MSIKKLFAIALTLGLAIAAQATISINFVGRYTGSTSNSANLFWTSGTAGLNGNSTVWNQFTGQGTLVNQTLALTGTAGESASLKVNVSGTWGTNGASGPNDDIMNGYLVDGGTASLSLSNVVSGLTASFPNGYSVYVYLNGSTSGRVIMNRAEAKDVIAKTWNGTFNLATATTPGSYVVFTNLSADSFSIVGGRLGTTGTFGISALEIIPGSGPLSLYMATNGSDANAGTISAPLLTVTGARNLIRTKRTAGQIPAAGVTVWIRGGSYPTANTTFGATDSGTASAPVTFASYPGETAIFDGLVPVSPTAFTQVSDGTHRAYLHTGSAQTSVYSQVITDSTMIGLLSRYDAQMSFNGKMMLRASFPNIGMAQVNTTVTQEATSGTGTYTSPLGALFTLKESIDATKWNAEMNRLTNCYANGYVSAVWHKEAFQVKSVNASTGNIKLVDRTDYGWMNSGMSGVGRLYFENVLCELDQAGEWYFDQTENRLYVWPYSTINSSTVVGVWNGTRVFDINGNNYMRIRNLVFQHLGAGPYALGAVEVEHGDYNEIAGCTFRRISPVNAGAKIVNGTHNRILSCDYYDIGATMSILGGGSANATNITYGYNTIENCHFTQIDSRNYYGKITQVQGAGNTFKNNLFHNMNGQPLVYLGNDHFFTLNEMFNVQVEEGDGGAMYIGGEVKAYGNKFTFNFLHHLMGVPGIFGHMGLYPDDYSGGQTYNMNVFYKAGMDAVHINSGAGNTVQSNVFLSGYNGVYVGSGGTSAYNTAMSYFPGNPTSGDKANYIGRMLMTCGVSGWQTSVTSNNWNTLVSSYWTSRYPYFNNVIGKYFTSKAMFPDEDRIYNNLFFDNNHLDFTGSTHATVTGSTTISMALFVDPNVLNFQFLTPLPAYAPNIPFASIGLYPDAYRLTTPNKDSYRSAVKSHFSPWRSYTTDPYDYTTANSRIYYNTGQLLQGLGNGVNGPLFRVAPAAIIAPQVTISADAAAVTLQWPGAANQVYTIECATTPAGPWVEMPDTISSVQPTTSATIKATGNCGFYRVKASIAQ
jgi:hypothetical protein